MWGAVYISNADGSHPVLLTPPSCEARNPKWAPNGKRIVLTCGRNNATRIFVSDVGNKSLHSLTSSPWAVPEPIWSHRGDRVFFSALALNAPDYEIYWMRPRANGAAHLVTTSAAASGENPAISSDDGWIAFDCGGADEPVGTPGTPFGICAVRPDGSGFRRLLTNASFPSWRP
jgi:Tol biopolymer transport system component